MSTLRLCFRKLLNTTSYNYNTTRQIQRYVAPTLMEIVRRKKRSGPQPIPKRSTFIEWNREAEIYAFNERLKENFDSNLLNQAFVFKSYVEQEIEKQKTIGAPVTFDLKHNEDLCSEGTKITSKAVQSYLKTSLPYVPKDGIQAFHDYLLSEKVLAAASNSIGTRDIILSEEHPVTKKTLADTFLALVGALAESTNEEQAALFVRDFLITVLADKDLLEIWSPPDPLQTLNDLLSEKGRGNVEPRLISEAGRNTLLSSFQVGLYSDKEFLGSGFGQTIEEAQEVACTNALCRVFGLSESRQPLRFNKQIDMS